MIKNIKNIESNGMIKKEKKLKINNFHQEKGIIREIKEIIKRKN